MAKLTVTLLTIQKAIIELLFGGQLRPVTLSLATDNNYRAGRRHLQKKSKTRKGSALRA